MFKKRVVKGLVTQNKTDWSAVLAAIFWAVVVLAILGSLGS